MNDLVFISDVIYGLKQEYGVLGTIVRQTESVNLSTGVKSFNDVFRVPIPRIIFLPTSWRKLMAQKGKGGIQSFGTQEILIDKKDIPSTVDIEEGDFINAKGMRIDIGHVDNYEYAFVVTAKTLEGMPLG